ncbi:hypothetical protein EIELFIGP_02424 [Stenotrophomonas maltophilia]|nr:hypothetical protein EIELFIGP_02424 [Stenotrophomonas maltophilia]QNG83653.1 hypothetical protein FLFIOBJN_03707 [Stenotrophomonas maltophilia]
MPLAHQRTHRLVREAGFQIHFAAIGHRRGLTRRFSRAFVLDARRITGFLQVHPEIHQVHHDLRMALRLHRAAHHAEAGIRLAALGDEPRNDGLEWTLARRVAVGMVLLQHEHLATVLQDETQTGRCHAAAHATVVGLDQRNHHAVGVGHGHVDRVALLQLLRRARLHFLQRLVHRNQRAALRGVLLGDELLHRRRLERHVGVEACTVGEGQLLRFDKQVHVFR